VFIRDIVAHIRIAPKNRRNKILRDGDHDSILEMPHSLVVDSPHSTTNRNNSTSLDAIHTITTTLVEGLVLVGFSMGLNEVVMETTFDTITITITPLSSSQGEWLQVPADSISRHQVSIFRLRMMLVVDLR